MEVIERAILWLFCISFALGDWVSEYNDDPRPVCPTELDKKPVNDRIVGGKDAGIGTFPYAVGISIGRGESSQLRAGNAFCGGTLITDHNVLTAAHCLEKNLYLKDYLLVNVNDYDTSSPNEIKNYLRKVARIDIHPDYVEDTFDNDIAVITFGDPIPLDENIRMAILPPYDRKLDVGTVCTVWGWGRTSYDGSRTTVIQKVDVPITSKEDCQKHLSHRITKNMICAGGKEGKDACLGDSGGSLLSRDGNVYCLAGVVSFGKNCALKGVSGVYTNVAKYTDWIYEVTKRATCKPRILL